MKWVWWQIYECFVVLGASDYQADNSLHVADHLVNGNVYDDDTIDDYYEPTHHTPSPNIQVTPQKRRG